MPFQPINFASIPPQGNPALRNAPTTFLDALKLAMQIRNAPVEYQRQGESEDLANQAAAYNQSPEQLKRKATSQDIIDALHQAQIDKFKKADNDPYGGEIPPGDIGQAYWLSLLKKRVNPNDPNSSELYENANKVFNLDLKNKSILGDYRQNQSDTMDKKYSTPLGKTILEDEDIKNGFLPGTGRSIEITPEQKKELAGKYGLKIQKETTDSTARAKNLIAKNIENTFSQFDPNDLVQYSGIKGGFNKALDASSAAMGKIPENYQKHQNAITDINVLTDQIRQFYGTSIDPKVREELKSLANPERWYKDPQVALGQFNELKSLLRKELGTYQKATKSTDVYNSTPDKSESNGITTLFKNGEVYDIPTNKIEKALKSGYTRNK
jgi:hypothetical protein